MINSILKLLGEKEFSRQRSNKPWIERKQFYDLLPYEAYEEESGLFYNGGSTGFILKGFPLVGSRLNDQEQLAQFFCQKEYLPEGASLQILLVSSPRVGAHLDWWSSYRKIHDDTHKAKTVDYYTLAQRRTQLFKEKALGTQPYRISHYYVLVSVTFPGIVINPLEKEQILFTRNSLINTFSSIGCHTNALDAKGFLQEVSNLLNFENSVYDEPVQYKEYESLSKQILNRGQTYAKEKNHLVINEGQETETICKSYVPKYAPDVWALHKMDEFLGNSLLLDKAMLCPFWIHYGLTIAQNQAQAKSKVIMRREALENSLKNRLTKWMPGLPEQHEEADSCLKELNQGERVIHSCLSATLFASKKEFSKCEARMRQIWTSCGWDPTPTTFDHLPMLIASLPMTWTTGEEKNTFDSILRKKFTGYGFDLAKMGKAKLTLTREAQNMFPILGEWLGQSAPGMLLHGRRGQVFSWSPFSTALLPYSKGQTDHNYNVCIAGQSGSGKSVFMQELMVSVLGVGGKVFVMDYGRSFKKTCQLLGGQHIEFDIRNPMSLNPFNTIPSGNTPEEISIREESLATLKPILQVMAAPKQGTNDLQNSLLERALRNVWEEHKTNASIDHIEEYLSNREDVVGKALGDMLFPFTSKGVYGKFFQGPAQASLTEDLVVIETDHLRNHPSLMAVLVQMMILQINQSMARGDRQRPYLIIIDEGWKLLSGKNTGDFIDEVTRTARKYKGGLVIGTQHLKDYFEEITPAARKAFDCSAWKVMLYQETDALKALKEHEQLRTFLGNDYLESLLCSLKPVPPHFSEVAIFGPDVKGVVGRLSLDPFMRRLYSTNPEEYQELENLMKEGHDVVSAIEIALKREKR